MKKILILGTGRTASKLYKEVLNRHEDIYILHELMFDFHLKKDIDFFLRKYHVYKHPENIKYALDDVYSLRYFRNFRDEYPNKEELFDLFKQKKELDWSEALNELVTYKAQKNNFKYAGAKNPVHFSFTPRVMRKFNDLKVLYLVRDPRSIYASEIPMKFKDSNLSQFPRFKNKFLQRTLIFLYTTLEWTWSMIIYKRVKHKVMLCKYEELVSDPHKVFQDVFKYLDIEYRNELTQNLSVIGSSYLKNSPGMSEHGTEKWKTMLNLFEKVWFTTLIKLFNYS